MTETTLDGFLAGRLTIEQPRRGYRAGADPVILAAAVASGATRALELGCGVGTALCCLGARLPEVDLTGLEYDPGLADLARGNLERNGLEGRVITGDVAKMPPELLQERFDTVMMNPPFFDRSRGTAAEDRIRETGRGEQTPLARWLDAAARRLLPRGRLVMIHRTDRLPETFAAIPSRLGTIALRPLAAASNAAAERVLLTAIKEGRGKFTLFPPLILHAADGGDSAAATAILREGLSLDEASLRNR